MITECGEQIAVVANQIIRARHRLDPLEQKVIAFGIGQIARDDTDFMRHTISIADFAELTGSTSGRIYAQMSDVTKRLMQAIIEIRENEGDRIRKTFQWLTECDYNDKQGSITFKFHERLKPYLLELKSRFTQIRLEQFYQFRSGYTIRFYERIEMMRGQNQMTFQLPLTELRDWLGITPEAYTKFGLFRAYVLDIAQRELDLKSDWSFSYAQMKTGRKVTGIEFTLRPARSPKTDPIRDRWKRANTALKSRVMAAARELSRWDGATDEAILRDDEFYKNLGMLFDRVDQGQTALGF